jgi:hypothetical protein
MQGILDVDVLASYLTQQSSAAAPLDASPGRRIDGDAASKRRLVAAVAALGRCRPALADGPAFHGSQGPARSARNGSFTVRFRMLTHEATAPERASGAHSLAPTLLRGSSNLLCESKPLFHAMDSSLYRKSVVLQSDASLSC